MTRTNELSRTAKPCPLERRVRYAGQAHSLSQFLNPLQPQCGLVCHRNRSPIPGFLLARWHSPGARPQADARRGVIIGGRQADPLLRAYARLSPSINPLFPFRGRGVYRGVKEKR